MNAPAVDFNFGDAKFSSDGEINTADLECFWSVPICSSIRQMTPTLIDNCEKQQKCCIGNGQSFIIGSME